MSLNQIRLSAQNGHSHQLQFNKESWAISELYWSLLRNYDSQKVEKIIIKLVDKKEQEFEINNIPNDVFQIKIYFDYDNYFSLTKDEKKQMQLDRLHSGMLKIANLNGWIIPPLSTAYNSCLDRKLTYKFWVQNQLKSSPNRKQKIGLWCEWEIDRFVLFWVLFDKKENEISRKLLVEREPHRGEFVYYLKWKWLDNEAILVEDKYKYGKGETWKIEI